MLTTINRLASICHGCFADNNAAIFHRENIHPKATACIHPMVDRLLPVPLKNFILGLIDFLIYHIVQQLIPPLLSMLPTLVSLFNVFAGSLMSALAPILNTVVGILVQLIDQMTPLLEVLMPPLIELLGSVLSLINALLPIFVLILSEAIIPLVELLLPPLIKLLEKVVTVATDLANWLSGHLKPAFDSISNAISGVVNWVNTLISKLTSIKLPDWLTPGSPTPFELGLRGIASALKEVNADIGGLTVNASAQPIASPTTVVVNVSSMMSLADMADAELKLQPIINNAVRRALA